MQVYGEKLNVFYIFIPLSYNMQRTRNIVLVVYTKKSNTDLHLNLTNCTKGGWSGGAKVLGKLSVPGRPTSLDDSRARAYCSCSRCGWGLFGHFFSRLSFLFSFSLSLGDGPI